MVENKLYYNKKTIIYFKFYRYDIMYILILIFDTRILYIKKELLKYEKSNEYNDSN